MTTMHNQTLRVDDETGLLETAYKAGKSTFSDDLTLADLIATEAAEETVNEVAAAEALGAYYEANDRKRSGTRDEKKARKVIDELPEGVYGGWKLAWEPNEDREALDEVAIKALYKRLGLELPKVKKPVAASLKVTRA